MFFDTLCSRLEKGPEWSKSVLSQVRAHLAAVALGKLKNLEAQTAQELYQNYDVLKKLKVVDFFRI